MCIEDIREQLDVVRKQYISYKDLMVLTGWGKTKACSVLKEIQVKKGCKHPFQSSLSKTQVVLAELGLNTDKLIYDLKNTLEEVMSNDSK